MGLVGMEDNDEILERLSVFTCGFWGIVAAILVKVVFHVSENDALIYAGLLVAVLMAAFMWPRLPKILGFDD